MYRSLARATRPSRPILSIALVAAMTATGITAGAAFAAAPGNDLRENATHIAALGSEVAGSTVEATSASEPVPSCGSGVGNTVWMRFRAAIALRVTASTATSDFDTVLQVYVATASGLSKVKCNDDAFGPSTPAALTFNATAGKLYYFQLGGYGGASGNYTFDLDGAPLNDYFATPAVAKSLPFSYQENTTFATGQAGERADCGSKANSVWFKYRRSSNASVSVDTFGSSYDTAIAVYAGTSLGSLLRIDCIDDSGGTPQSQVTWFVVGGQTYYIQVNGITSSAFGSLTLTMTRN